MTTPGLLVGAAKVDITPDYGMQISGDIGRYRPVEEIRNRLYARVFVLRAAETTVCIIACDMACISREHSLGFRKQIAELLDTRPEDVMIHCVQSHSAARVGSMFDDPEGILSPELWWVRGETPAYNTLFIDAVLAGVAQARDSMVPPGASTGAVPSTAASSCATGRPRRTPATATRKCCTARARSTRNSR